MTEAKRVPVIAEAGVNHNGSLDTALSLVDAASDAGADFVKFQTFKTEALVSSTAEMAPYQASNMNRRGTQYQMLKALELSHDDHFRLMDRCDIRGIRFLSTPFDLESLAFLSDRLGLQTIKLGSCEVTNAPLLVQAGRSGKNIILSTGMATLVEVQESLRAIAFGMSEARDPDNREAFSDFHYDKGAKSLLENKVSLMHCTTAYPCPFEAANLCAIDTLRDEFGLRSGFSDHSPGISLAIAAVGRGAQIIEKHLTMDRGMEGPDHRASLEPAEFKSMTMAIREVELALGDGVKRPAHAEIENMASARKSLIAGSAISAGDVFTRENLTVRRPGTGLSPFQFWNVLGKRATKAYAADQPIDEM